GVLRENPLEGNPLSRQPGRKRSDAHKEFTPDAPKANQERTKNKPTKTKDPPPSSFEPADGLRDESSGPYLRA
ncbi:MAG: hypothetical protein AAB288_06495, partial [Acidobacteriota bacterium]